MEIDCFGGTGTTAIAARKLGLKSILVELSESYCKIAEERLRQSVMFFDTIIPEEVKQDNLL